MFIRELVYFKSSQTGVKKSREKSCTLNIFDVAIHNF